MYALTMVPVLALIATFQRSPDFPLLAMLKDRLAVTKSRSSLKAELVASVPINESAFRLGLFQPQGGQQWVIPFLSPDFDSDGFLALATPAGKVYRLEGLMAVDSFMPMGGFFSGRDLVLGGLNGWMGNGPSGAAVLLRRDAKGWRLVNQVDSPFQSEHCKFVREGSSWVAKLDGTDYPVHLNVSHAMAAVGKTQRFIYSDGVLRADKPRRTMNPLAILDDIAGAAAEHHFSKIRPLCATDALARQMLRLGTGVSKSSWDIPGNVSSTSNRVYLSETLHLRFEFGMRSGHWILTSVRSVK
jgi:hypothetical protein